MQNNKVLNFDQWYCIHSTTSHHSRYKKDNASS